MKINRVAEWTPELTEFVKGFWHDADLEHYGHDSGWKYELIILLAQEDNNEDSTIGVLYAKLDAGVVFLDALIVDKDHQRQGIGSGLMTELERIAVGKDVHKIYLYTRADWKAIKLYEKFDFKKTADLPNHYLRLDWVEYTKFLKV